MEEGKLYEVEQEKTSVEGGQYPEIHARGRVTYENGIVRKIATS